MVFLENWLICPQDISCLFWLSHELGIGNQTILTSWAFFAFGNAGRIIFKERKWKWSIYLDSALTLKEDLGAGERKYQRGRGVFLPRRALNIRHVLLLRARHLGFSTYFNQYSLNHNNLASTVTLVLCFMNNYFFHWVQEKWLCTRLAEDHSFEQSKISSFKGNVGIVNSKYRSQLTGQLIPFGRCGFRPFHVHVECLDLITEFSWKPVHPRKPYEMERSNTVHSPANKTVSMTWPHSGRSMLQNLLGRKVQYWAWGFEFSWEPGLHCPSAASLRPLLTNWPPKWWRYPSRSETWEAWIQLMAHSEDNPSFHNSFKSKTRHLLSYTSSFFRFLPSVGLEFFQTDQHLIFYSPFTPILTSRHPS